MSPLPPDAQPFLDAISESPDDSHLRLVFADWLDEQGRHGAATACRWLAAGNRTVPEPTPRPIPDPYRVWMGYNPDRAAAWLWSGWTLDGMLPGVAGLSLPEDPSAGDGKNYWAYPTRSDAEVALLEAWPDDAPVPPS